MEAELKGQQHKKEQLEADIEMCSIKLDRAEKLIGGLGGEKARWEEAELELAKAQVRLVQLVVAELPLVFQASS
jgi:dynein heavy chain